MEESVPYKILMDVINFICNNLPEGSLDGIQARMKLVFTVGKPKEEFMSVLKDLMVSEEHYKFFINEVLDKEIPLMELFSLLEEVNV